MTRASNGRGTLILDKRFTRRGRRAIGRVQRSSGTHSPKTFHAICAMLDALYDQEEYAPIEAIRDRRYRAIDVYELYRQKRLHEITDTKSAATLIAAWEVWEKKSAGVDNQRMRRLARKKLTTITGLEAPISALPEAMRTLRDTLAAHQPTFNRCLAAAQAFVRDTLGAIHPLYDLVTAVGYAKYRKVKRPAPTLLEALQLRDALTGEAKDLWWAMCTTGMNPKEFDGAWEISGDLVAIHGTKRDGRERVVPRLGQPTRRAMGWKQYRAALAKAGLTVRTIGMQRNDARRCFRHLLEEAGIPRTRMHQYMGHAVATVDDGYGQVELRKFAPQDRATVLSYLALLEQQRKGGAAAELKLA